MSTALPATIKPKISDYESVTRTIVPIVANVIGPYAPGQMLSFKLPSGILDLSTLSIKYKIQFNAEAKVPEYSESIIRNFTVKTQGGVTLAQCNDYNEVMSVIQGYDRLRANTDRPYIMTTELVAASTVKAFKIDRLLFGPLSAEKSTLFSTESVPLQIDVTIAPLNQVFDKHGANAIDAQVTEMVMEATAVFFPNDSYSELIRASLNNGGLKLTYPTYSLHTSQQFVSGIDIQANVTSESIDGIMCYMKPANYMDENKAGVTVWPPNGAGGSNELPTLYTKYQQNIAFDDTTRGVITMNNHRLHAGDADEVTAYSSTVNLMEHLGMSGEIDQGRFSGVHALSASTALVGVHEAGTSGFKTYNAPANITTKLYNVAGGGTKVLKLAVFKTAKLILDSSNGLVVIE